MQSNNAALTFGTLAVVIMLVGSPTVAQDVITLSCEEYQQITGETDLCDISDSFRMTPEEYQDELDAAKERKCQARVQQEYGHCLRLSAAELMAGDAPDECYRIPDCNKINQPATKAPAPAADASVWD